MKRRIAGGILAVAITAGLLAAAGCTLSGNDKEITSFSFLAKDNPALTTDAVGSIGATEIELDVPFLLERSGLVASFASTGSNVRVDSAVQQSGVTSNDFSDRLAAVEYAAIVLQRERIGSPVSMPDAHIAAICRVCSAGLATRNTRDFENTGVVLINPWQA